MSILVTHWEFDTPDGTWSFRWHNSKTVNVYYDDLEMDVWTYQETPHIDEVRGDINDYLANIFDDKD